MGFRSGKKEITEKVKVREIWQSAKKKSKESY